MISKYEQLNIITLLQSNVHVGHITKKWDPKMISALYGIRDNIHIIDLERSIQSLQLALRFIRDVKLAGGTPLLIGTGVEHSSIIANVARRLAIPYISKKWIGGLLTNWSVVQQLLHLMKGHSHLDSLEKKKLDFRLRKRLDILQRSFSGIQDLVKLPEILIVFDVNSNLIVINEARKCQIPVIGIIDSDTNPDLVDYPIFGNKQSPEALHFYCQLIEQALQKE